LTERSLSEAEGWSMNEAEVRSLSEAEGWSLSEAEGGEMENTSNHFR